MSNYDWIVVGGGVTGAALGYELAKQGAKVLLLDSPSGLAGATRSSYGGLAHWAATTDKMRQLCQEGMARYRALAAELEADFQLRELEILLTVPVGADPGAIADSYAAFTLQPERLSVEEACQWEPLLNPGAIAGALRLPHGHLHPELLVQAYRRGFERLGGVWQCETVQALVRSPDGLHGVQTAQATYGGPVIVCAGGWSRALFREAGLWVPVYFTHAESLETAPLELRLQGIVMPAMLQRFEMEAQASCADRDRLWDEPDQEPAPPILDTGVVQFWDGHLRMGQRSRVLSDPQAQIDPRVSEQELRQAIGRVLPRLQDLPATWHHTLVSFSRDRLPLIGPIPTLDHSYVFSGLSNPLVIVPSLAQRFARELMGAPDPLLREMAPERFSR